MEPAWAYVVLLVYPALQVPLLWVVVRRLGLRNDDGPRDPVGYSLSGPDDGRTDRGELATGRCARCGVRNDPIFEYCKHCTSGL